MSLAYCGKNGVSLFQKCGTITRTRLVDIVKDAASVGVDVQYVGHSLHIPDVTLPVLAYLLSLTASQDASHHERAISRMVCHGLLSRHHSGTSADLS